MLMAQQWATQYIERLRNGETVQFRPKGKSMTGLIEPGQLVTVEPLNGRIPSLGDILLCTVRGTHYLHLVIQVIPNSLRQRRPTIAFQIGNNHGTINGQISIENVHGICVRVED